MHTEIVLASEGIILSFWTWFVTKFYKKNQKYFQMLLEKFPKPELWRNVQFHTKRAYCAECDPPPEPHDGEMMFCPKCDRPLAHYRHYVTKQFGESTEQTIVVPSPDWFCSFCQEMWPDAAARKFQTKWHRDHVYSSTAAYNAGSIPSDRIPGFTMSRAMAQPTRQFVGWGTLGAEAAQRMEAIDKRVEAMAASYGIGGDKNLANLIGRPPDEGYGDS